MTERVRVRMQGIAIHYGYPRDFYLPCPSPGCTGPTSTEASGSVEALSAEMVYWLTPAGSLYLISGPGVYRVAGQDSQTRVGITGGIGLSRSLGPAFRVTLESQWHRIPGVVEGPRLVGPLTLGVALHE